MIHRFRGHPYWSEDAGGVRARLSREVRRANSAGVSDRGFGWSSFDRVVVVSNRRAPTPADFDGLAAVITSVAERVRQRILFVQVSTISGGVAIHAVGRDTATPFARYAAAIRKHVEEVHAVSPGGGGVGGLLRGLVSAVTKLGPNPSIFHPDVDTLVAELRRRHAVEPSALREAIARACADGP